MKKQLSTKEKKGFTLLFAVIVSTLVLAVGGSIISIALKQVILSGIGRESQYAFYAANTGIECALYWDIAGVGGVSAFATGTASAFIKPTLPAGCAGTPNIYDSGISYENGGAKFEINSQGNISESSFYLQNFTDAQGKNLEYCAFVTVTKTSGDGGLLESTKIESRGYNTCNKENPRRIERGLEMHY